MLLCYSSKIFLKSNTIAFPSISQDIASKLRKTRELETSDGIAVRFSAELLIERVFNFLGQKFCAAVAKQKLRSATVLRSKSPRKIPVALGKALWMS